MKLAIVLSVILTACGSSESGGGASASPTPIPLDITSVKPVFDGMETSFEAEFTEPGKVDGKNIVPVLILLEASYGVTPAACTAAYKFKFVSSTWYLEPGIAYNFRACLYDMDQHKFSPGVAGTFVAE